SSRSSSFCLAAPSDLLPLTFFPTRRSSDLFAVCRRVLLLNYRLIDNCSMNDRPKALTNLRPGNAAKFCGIYRCDCGKEHECTISEIAQKLPRFPPDCTASTWNLIQETSMRHCTRRTWPSGQWIADAVAPERGSPRRIRLSSM